MLGKLFVPDSISKRQLDQFLLHGWYRMGQSIFTCHVLNFNFTYYNAIWLRIDLKSYQSDTTFIKLQKKNARFRVEVTNATITEVEENLFLKYKSSRPFEPADTLKDLLFHQSETNIFNTKQISIYDNTKLIASGYFDVGVKSVAGIVSFYDPDYKSHSLGKYLIYQKIAHCQREGFRYFYPGYFVPGYPAFDYKLSIGHSSLAYYDLISGKWHSIAKFNSKNCFLPILFERLQIAEKHLEKHQIRFTKYFYEYYNANIIPNLKDFDLFDYPAFIFVEMPKVKKFKAILIYDVVVGEYFLLDYFSYFYDGTYQSDNGYYGENLLKISDELCRSKDLDEMVRFILKYTVVSTKIAINVL